MAFFALKVDDVIEATAGQPLPAVVNTACAFVALVASMVLTGGTTAHYYDITGEVLFSGSHPDVSVSRVRRPAHAVYTASIVNASLHQGRLPDSQKHVIIIPMLKKPGLDTADMANFRPVSNLPFMWKVTERAALLGSYMNTYLWKICSRAANRPTGNNTRRRQP